MRSVINSSLLEDYSRTDYISFSKFAEEHNNITYSEFDSFATEGISLFAIRENLDFEELEATLDIIIRELPVIKRIFAHPIIRLKDSGAVLPTEAVRVINNKTVLHASTHSEFWEHDSEQGARPRKLLTLEQEDDYSIYENIAFVKMVDMIQSYVRKHLRLLGSMLYANRDMHFNLLERVNHLSYFLAIGKLHIGYVHDYDKYRETAVRSINKMLFINKVIDARLGSPVYKKCKKHHAHLKLKKTNIFRMHKDYSRIYSLLKYFYGLNSADEKDSPVKNDNSETDYRLFTVMLSIFAAGHFNFKFPNDDRFDLYDIHTRADFKSWSLCIDSLCVEKIYAVSLTFTKDTTYRIILLPACDTDKAESDLTQLRKSCDANEYLIVSPYNRQRDAVCISIFDIESFRRIQQLLLRGMVHSDISRDICPFCGGSLTKAEDSPHRALHECDACRTQIFRLFCPSTSRHFTATQIKNYHPSNSSDPLNTSKRDLLYFRYAESQLHFRNITEIGDKGSIICPNCGEAHIL